MVQRLTRQSPRFKLATVGVRPSHAFSLVDPNGELHERVKPFAVGPGAFGPPSTQGRIDEVWVDLDEIVWTVA